MSPWERRERGGLYYTRSRKVNGKVVREYVGGGALGTIAALEDEYERCRREEETAFWKEERARLEELAALVDEFCADIETITRAALLAAGFRRHKRGEWRKNVNQKLPQKSNSAAVQHYKDRAVGRPPDPNLSAMTQGERDARGATVERFSELVKKAEKGDKKAVPDIREILEENPDLAWRYIDFARIAEWHFTERMSKDKDFASKEVLKRQLAAMREEIAGENPSPLERLLAERIVLTWQQIQLFEGLYASGMFKGGTISQGNYYQKRLDHTYRRHLSAIRTLAQIRKLGPAIQVNIAEKQINTVGTT